MSSRMLYLSERASGPSDSPLDTFIPLGRDNAIPYLSKVDKDLYVGGVNPTLLLPPWIEYVVSLHPVEYRQIHELEGFAHFKVSDSEKQDPSVFSLVSNILADFWTRGPTLVHCAVGLNRAPTAAVLAMMKVKGISSYTAIQVVKSARGDGILFNKTFEAYLHAQNRVGTVLPENTPNPAAFEGKDPEDSDIFDGPIEGFDDEGQKTRIWHRRAS